MKIAINYIEFTDFSEVNISFNYDSVSDVFSFIIPISEVTDNIKRVFKPLSYQIVTIYNDKGVLLCTGKILNYKFKTTPNGTMLAISGASRTSVLDDCPNISNSMAQKEPFVADIKDVNSFSYYELGKVVDTIEAVAIPQTVSTCYNQVSLKQFAENLVNPFAIGVSVDEIVRERCEHQYEQTTTDTSQTVAQKLSEMAKLKNIVMRSDANGNLLFTQISPETKPKMTLFVGDGVLLSFDVEINGQDMHSDIHVAGRTSVTDESGTGQVAKISNPICLDYRPTMIEQTMEVGQVVDCTKSALAKELQKIKFILVTKGWDLIDIHGLVSGDVITLKWFFMDVNIVLRNISLKENADGKFCNIDCCLVEAITGEQPNLIFN